MPWFLDHPCNAMESESLFRYNSLFVVIYSFYVIIYTKCAGLDTLGENTLLCSTDRSQDTTQHDIRDNTVVDIFLLFLLNPFYYTDFKWKVLYK